MFVVESGTSSSPPEWVAYAANWRIPRHWPAAFLTGRLLRQMRSGAISLASRRGDNRSP